LRKEPSIKGKEDLSGTCSDDDVNAAPKNISSEYLWPE
jgi:hypothetical protein